MHVNIVRHCHAECPFTKLEYSAYSTYQIRIILKISLGSQNRELLRKKFFFCSAFRVHRWKVDVVAYFHTSQAAWTMSGTRSAERMREKVNERGGEEKKRSEMFNVVSFGLRMYTLDVCTSMFRIVSHITTSDYANSAIIIYRSCSHAHANVVVEHEHCQFYDAHLAHTEFHRKQCFWKKKKKKNTQKSKIKFQHEKTGDDDGDGDNYNNLYLELY